MKNEIIKFFQANKISPTGYIQNSLQNDNKRALHLIHYLINNIIEVKGAKELIQEVASIRINKKDGLRIYHNYLQQLHSIYFIRNKLKYKILEVESRSHKIFSPYGSAAKSCDIKAQKNGRVYYFESKDFSEIFELNEHLLPKIVALEKQTEKWIAHKCKDAIKQGANYLICRVDLEQNFNSNLNAEKEYFYNQWIDLTFDSIFTIKRRISNNVIKISTKLKWPKTFLGIFIIKQYGYLFLKL